MIKRIFAPVLMFMLMAITPFVLLLLQLSTTLVQAGDLHEWDASLFSEPTPQQLQQECDGRIRIYDGPGDLEVKLSLDSGNTGSLA
jgi:hypothetical protein